MGRTGQAKRKVPITASSNTRFGVVGDNLPISASSTSTRTVIRRFHVLIKKREQLLREITGQNRKRKVLASGVDYLSPKEKLSRIERDIGALGGLERYQAMSSIGQSAAKGGGSEKVLISWIREMSPKKTVDSMVRLR
jgi:25S rRNA (adenine2142-N1)-methyltransferase